VRQRMSAFWGATDVVRAPLPLPVLTPSGHRQGEPIAAQHCPRSSDTLFLTSWWRGLE
jgi:hypothetical protein